MPVMLCCFASAVVCETVAAQSHPQVKLGKNRPLDSISFSLLVTVFMMVYVAKARKEWCQQLDLSESAA